MFFEAKHVSYNIQFTFGVLLLRVLILTSLEDKNGVSKGKLTFKQNVQMNKIPI